MLGQGYQPKKSAGEFVAPPKNRNGKRIFGREVTFHLVCIKCR